jgi:hypothetical protein
MGKHLPFRLLPQGHGTALPDQPESFGEASLGLMGKKRSHPLSSSVQSIPAILHGTVDFVQAALPWPPSPDLVQEAASFSGPTARAIPFVQVGEVVNVDVRAIRHQHSVCLTPSSAP